MTTRSNKVAIVTGASGGIGAAVAERLAEDGFIVVVNYAGNAASAEAVVAGIEAGGGRAVVAQADISDVAAVARMFDSAETAFGGVDVLINNAGIMNLATIKDSDDALFDRQIAINLKGTFKTLREALFLDGKPQEVIDRLSKMAPLERLGQPKDIADAVAFLAGPDGAWINGQTLRANGGITDPDRSHHSRTTRQSQVRKFIMSKSVIPDLESRLF
jgi:NAD(P)-dependent dehydrogenase (short-subunit alcohol dehydrogenase family)